MICTQGKRIGIVKIGLIPVVYSRTIPPATLVTKLTGIAVKANVGVFATPVTVGHRLNAAAYTLHTNLLKDTLEDVLVGP
jgi:hypothetical protein